MLDLLATIALGIAGACLLALGVRVLGRQPVRAGAFAAAILSLLFYWAVVVAGAEVQGAFMPSLKWNWIGKIISTAAVLAAIGLIPNVDRKDVGLNVRQRPGSIGPALVCLVLLCALSWGVEAWANDGRDLSPERIAFQALMPGLDEELFFRGLFLTLLVRAFDERWELLGAQVGPAAAVATFLFGAGHGLTVADGQLHFDPLAFALTGTIGFGLLWLRQRTGSLLLPIGAHNIINVGNSFF